MKLFVYPYRQKDGFRSILEAVDVKDAMRHLSAYEGTVFCQIETPEDFPSLHWREDFDDIVDRYLDENEIFTT